MMDGGWWMVEGGRKKVHAKQDAWYNKGTKECTELNPDQLPALPAPYTPAAEIRTPPDTI
jgi:hypothetical protein